MDSNSRSSYNEDLKQMQVKISYNLLLENGQFGDPVEIPFIIQPEEIRLLFQFLYPQDSLSDEHPEDEIIEVTDIRLKDGLPNLYNAITKYISEELTSQGLEDKSYKFELLICRKELISKDIEIEYIIAMFKLGRRVEQHRRDELNNKSNY